MDTKLWVQEFQEKFARQMESRVPVTITHDGTSTIVYLPKERPTEADWKAMRLAGEKIDEMIKAAGVSEEELMEDLDRLHREARTRQP